MTTPVCEAREKMTSNGTDVTSRISNTAISDCLPMRYIVLLNSSNVPDGSYDNQSLSRSFYYARLAIVSATMVTFIWGFLGNTVVLYVVGRHANVRIKSVANYYIWNMAMADLLYILALPVTGFVTFYDSWPFGGLLGTISCKLADVLRETTKFTSMFTLAALTVDRCLASYPNLGQYRKIRCGKVVCAVVWTCSLIATSPLFVFATAITFEESTSCVTAWPSHGTEASDLAYIIPWTAFDIIVGFLTPTFIILTSYVHLFRRLRHQSAAAHRVPRAAAAAVRQNPGDDDVIADVPAVNRVLLPPRENRVVASHRGRMTRTVVVAIVTHISLLLPYHVTQLISVERTVKLLTSGKIVFSPAGLHAFMWGSAVAQILVFVSSCCNPVIYGIMNDNFRRLYVSTLCPTACRRGQLQPGNRQQPAGSVQMIGSHLHLGVQPVALINDANEDQVSNVEPDASQLLAPAVTVRCSGSSSIMRSRAPRDMSSHTHGSCSGRMQFHVFYHSPCRPSVAKRKRNELCVVAKATANQADVTVREKTGRFVEPFGSENRDHAHSTVL